MEPIKKLVKQAITQIERERDHFATSLNITGTQMSVIDYLSNMPNYTASQNEIEQEFDIRHEYMKQDDLKLRANFTDEELEITRKVLNVIKNG